jgi:hypothetical protein
MTVLEHLERQVAPPLARETTPVWWSPLSHVEVEQALEKLGASRLGSDTRSARFAFELADDPFAQSLVVEPEPCEHGSVLRLRALQLGFGRDFKRVVQVGLTLFAALVALSAAANLTGHTLITALVAVGFVWALVMGLYAALRALTHVFVENRRAYDRTWSKVRIALFARRLS